MSVSNRDEALVIMDCFTASVGRHHFPRDAEWAATARKSNIRFFKLQSAAMTNAEELGLLLLVDDDRVTNLMHKRQIARRGLARQVDVVTDGRAALDYLTVRVEQNASMPDLILLDINMPRMNGFEFLDGYRPFSENPELTSKIIMVSTSTLQQDKERATGYPYVSGYETKPLGDQDLERIIRAV